jgi:hypothetical protein
MPRLRRFKVSMLAAPLSTSTAAGVSASTSEMRAAPCEHKTKETLGRRKALRGFKKSAPLGGVQIFAVVRLLPHKHLG